MGEVPLYLRFNQVCTMLFLKQGEMLHANGGGRKVHRGASFIRNHTSIGTYSKTVPRALGCS